MSIQFPHQQEQADDGLIASINTTPLVDVMLVLLIIFLITIPVVNSSVSVSLPREPANATEAQPNNIIVTVDASGSVYWFDTPVPSVEMLQAALTTAAGETPQPELHIRADMRADYESIGQVVHAAQQAGLSRVGFLTEPPP
jgi:biopolymer transport protein ExbD